MADFRIRVIETAPCDFDCGKESINRMVEDAYQSTLLQFATAYEVIYNNTIVGYFMMVFKKIIINDMPEEFREYESALENCVAAHIRFIAINKLYQHKKLGTATLQIIEQEVNKLIKKWPVRLITLDATPDNIEWYQKYGYTCFEYAPTEVDGYTVQMYKDVWTDENKRLEEQYLEELM